MRRLADQSANLGRLEGKPVLPSWGLLRMNSASAAPCGNSHLWNSSDFPAPGNCWPFTRLTPGHTEVKMYPRRRLPRSFESPQFHPVLHTLRKKRNKKNPQELSIFNAVLLLISCVSLARLWCPDVRSNTILDIVVKVFCRCD